jgi:cytidylate kinase
MNFLPVVTIDGPAGVGKSTLAARLAEKLRIARLDTGAMFRYLAFKLGPDAGHLTEEELRGHCAKLAFNLAGSGAHTRLLCNGQVVGEEVRSEEVGMLASRIATVPAVRDALKAAQRAIGERIPLLAEGRDMGTVVFPDARFKFFLDATAQVRARRRMLDLEKRGATVDLSTLAEQIHKRDEMDRSRVTAPLRAAADALIVDTSNRDIDSVLGVLLLHIEAGGGAQSLLVSS